MMKYSQRVAQKLFGKFGEIRAKIFRTPKICSCTYGLESQLSTKSTREIGINKDNRHWRRFLNQYRTWFFQYFRMPS